MQPTIILDFDRTTFMTEQFVAMMITALSQEFEIAETVLREELIEFTTDPLLNYDYYLHLKSRYGLDTAAATKVLETRLAGQAFVYDDVVPWLTRHSDYDIRIVTTGRDNYQHLKLRFAPQLAQLPFMVTDELKGNILDTEIRHHLLNGDVWLVDDNPASFARFIGEKGTRSIHIKRPGTRYAAMATPDGVEEISSLSELT